MDNRKEPEIQADLILANDAAALNLFEKAFYANDQKYLLPICFCLRIKYPNVGSNPLLGKLIYKLLEDHFNLNLNIYAGIVGQIYTLLWLYKSDSGAEFMLKIMKHKDCDKIMLETLLDLRSFALFQYELHLQDGKFNKLYK